MDTNANIDLSRKLLAHWHHLCALRPRASRPVRSTSFDDCLCHAAHYNACTDGPVANFVAVRLLRHSCAETIRDNGDKGPKAIATTATRRRWATRKPRRRRRGDHRVKAMSTRCHDDHRATTMSHGMDLYSTSTILFLVLASGSAFSRRTLAQQSHVTMAMTPLLRRLSMLTWQSRTATTIHRNYDNDCTDCGYNGNCDVAAVIAWRSQSSDEVIRGNHSDGDKAATIGDYDEVTAMVRPRGSASIPLRVKGNPPSTHLTRSHPYPYARVPVPVTAAAPALHVPSVSPRHPMSTHSHYCQETNASQPSSMCRNNNDAAMHPNHNNCGSVLFIQVPLLCLVPITGSRVWVQLAAGIGYSRVARPTASSLPHGAPAIVASPPSSVVSSPSLPVVLPSLSVVLPSLTVVSSLSATAATIAVVDVLIIVSLGVAAVVLLWFNLLLGVLPSGLWTWPGDAGFVHFVSIDRSLHFPDAAPSCTLLTAATAAARAQARQFQRQRRQDIDSTCDNNDNYKTVSTALSTTRTRHDFGHHHHRFQQDDINGNDDNDLDSDANNKQLATPTTTIAASTTTTTCRCCRRRRR
ncbi:hypothetical protein EDB85DRAFT_1893986 [Lactarius pseudohatsudake]|nr:hypothetical protein EDB85DRAFT_1893986 [Lactarius pseudohatsudake]